MKVCPQCNSADVPDTAKICPFCGKELNVNKETKKQRKKFFPFLGILLFVGMVGGFCYSIYNSKTTEKELLLQKDMEVSKSDNSMIDKNITKKEELETEFTYSTEAFEQANSSTELNTEEHFSPEQTIDAVETESEIPSISMDAISDVSATSYLSESKYGLVHHPSNLIDGTLSNAWVEDAYGQGEGESVTFYFNGTYKLSGFMIYAGYQKNADVFDKNSRPATLLITFSDGSSMDITLEDKNEQQQVNFPFFVETSSVTFTIQSVYSGSKYQDTVISEIQLF